MATEGHAYAKSCCCGALMYETDDGELGCVKCEQPAKMALAAPDSDNSTPPSTFPLPGLDQPL